MDRRWFDTEFTDFDAVILGNGDFPQHEVGLSVLNNSRFLCCCDAAGFELIKRGGHPDAIVGDGDSLTVDEKLRYADIFHLVTEQEDNDLTKATRFCLQNPPLITQRSALPLSEPQRRKNSALPRIAYIGTTGKREDHTLGNIALIVRYAKRFNIEPVMITDYGWFTVCSGKQKFSSEPHQQVSIFNMGCTRLSSENLKWNAYPYNEFWQGTLNEALGTEFTLDGNGYYLVYRTFDPKI